MLTHHLAASFTAVFISVALVGQLGASLEELEDQGVRLTSHVCATLHLGEGSVVSILLSLLRPI